MYVLVLDHDKWCNVRGYTRGAWMVYGCATSKTSAQFADGVTPSGF